jgi:hypothetical protein
MDKRAHAQQGAADEMHTWVRELFEAQKGPWQKLLAEDFLARVEARAEHFQ